jgi:hypothetical protein
VKVPNKYIGSGAVICHCMNIFLVSVLITRELFGLGNTFRQPLAD